MPSVSAWPTCAPYRRDTHSRLGLLVTLSAKEGQSVNSKNGYQHFQPMTLSSLLSHNHRPRSRTVTHRPSPYLSFSSAVRCHRGPIHLWNRQSHCGAPHPSLSTETACPSTERGSSRLVPDQITCQHARTQSGGQAQLLVGNCLETACSQHKSTRCVESHLLTWFILHMLMVVEAYWLGDRQWNLRNEGTAPPRVSIAWISVV
jgi:hypothetical protein